MELKHKEIWEGSSCPIDGCHGYKTVFSVGLSWREEPVGTRVLVLLCGSMLSLWVSLVLREM